MRRKPGVSPARKPSHQLVARKARVGAQDDAHVRPALADLRDDARDLVPGAIGGILVGASELGGEQVPAGEDVKRQIAIAVVERIEVPPFLLAVDRIVRGIEIDDQPSRRLVVGVGHQRHEQPFDRGRVVRDLVIVGPAPTLAACSSRLSVDLPASGAQSERLAVRVPPSTPSTGSWRS